MLLSPEILTHPSSAGSWREQGEPVPQEERVPTAGAGGVESGSADPWRGKGEGHAAPPAIPQHPSSLWSFSAWVGAHRGPGHSPAYHSILPQPVHIGLHAYNNRGLSTTGGAKDSCLFHTQVSFQSGSCCCFPIHGLIYLICFWVAWKILWGYF